MSAIGATFVAVLAALLMTSPRPGNRDNSVRVVRGGLQRLCAHHVAHSGDDVLAPPIEHELDAALAAADETLPAHDPSSPALACARPGLEPAAVVAKAPAPTLRVLSDRRTHGPDQGRAPPLV